MLSIPNGLPLVLGGLHNRKNHPRRRVHYFYGCAEIHADQEVDTWLWIGIDDTGKVWLNDCGIYNGIDANKG